MAAVNESMWRRIFEWKFWPSGPDFVFTYPRPLGQNYNRNVGQSLYKNGGRTFLKKGAFLLEASRFYKSDPAFAGPSWDLPGGFDDILVMILIISVMIFWPENDENIARQIF